MAKRTTNDSNQAALNEAHYVNAVTNSGFTDVYAFSGSVEFQGELVVAGHKVSQRFRIAYRKTPEGEYFDPMLRRNLDGNGSMSFDAFVRDRDNTWAATDYSLFMDHGAGGYIGDLDEHIMLLIDKDIEQKQSEARAIHERK